MPALRLAKSFFAAAISLGFVNRSMAESVSVLAATIMPLWPMLMPAQAVDCQEWPGVPGTKVAVPKPAVGTTQLTSPTSVEP